MRAATTSAEWAAVSAWVAARTHLMEAASVARSARSTWDDAAKRELEAYARMKDMLSQTEGGFDV